MIAVDELRGIIVSKGLTQEKVATMLGITAKTFYEKMKKGVFSSGEIEAMMEILNIEDPRDIFFRKNVT